MLKDNELQFTLVPNLQETAVACLALQIPLPNILGTMTSSVADGMQNVRFKAATIEML